MTPESALKILSHHQKWRLGADIPPTDPKELTAALDVAIAALGDPSLAWRDQGFQKWREQRG